MIQVDADIKILVQARMESERLPGKILRPVYKKTLLENTIAGLEKEKVCVLSSKNPQNQAVHDLCNSIGIECICGHETDVFSRFHEYLCLHPCNYTIRLTADNPVIAKEFIPKLISFTKKNDFDYASMGEIWLGGSVEIFRTRAFLKMNTPDLEDCVKEHVTPLFYRDNLSKTKIIYKRGSYLCGFSDLKSLRLTVDTLEDLELVREIGRIFQKDPCELSALEIRELWIKNPAIFQKNSHIIQRSL